MSKLISWIDNKFYPHFVKNWDDRLLREEILSHVTPDSIVLDLGAGAGIVSDMNFLGLVKKICGVDLDTRVLDNPMLNEGKVADANGIPYPDETFDVVFADNVIEHIADPYLVFSDVWRVLKPGGVFLFKTPNKTHYMPLIARFTPHCFHQFINKVRGRAEVDTFPTLYRANSRVAVESICNKTGFKIDSIQLIEGRPEYLRMFWLTYLIGVIYERLVNLSSFFGMFRILLIATLKK